VKTQNEPRLKPKPRIEGIVFHNALAPGHRYHATAEAALRVALVRLGGPWDVNLHPEGNAWFRVDIVAPDGTGWGLSVPTYQGPSPVELAEAIRAACARHLIRSAERPGQNLAGAELLSPAGSAE
jgi:hypothetical protein